MNNELTAKNTTHNLRCAHVMCGNRQEYDMDCHILKEMKDKARAKVLVFGDRFWRGIYPVGKVRYVDKRRVRRKPLPKKDSFVDPKELK